MKENKVSIDTMAGVGKKKTIAGREYTILPVNICDMHYIMGENNKEENLIIVDKQALEKEEVNWQLFGLNITDENRKKTFLKILNKYVFYKDIPMTENMLIEHNWSFKEIGEFLFVWSQISD
ncbi:MAG: hypothetical protein MR691_08390 [Clostridium sp.]|nr:hypothetical protein [Clostridium sp.]